MRGVWWIEGAINTSSLGVSREMSSSIFVSVIFEVLRRCKVDILRRDVFFWC